MFMKIVLAVAVLGGSVTLARADEDEFSGPGYLSRQQVISQLQSAGYTVTKVKADDGRYKVKALTAARQKIKLSVDPHTGAILAKGDDDDD
jgi:hypothetical protein